MRSAKQKHPEVCGNYAKQKQPCPGVIPGTGYVQGQMNPRRNRTEDYTPTPQPREGGVKI